MELSNKELDKALAEGKIISVLWNGSFDRFFKTIYFLNNNRLCYVDIIKDEYGNMTQSKIFNSAYESISSLLSSSAVVIKKK